MNYEFYMQQVLELAQMGRYSARPNPMVGCVIVKNNVVVGKGFHHARGLLHAEPQALAEAGNFAKNATLYVNLEPCNHTGLTPPCCDAILKAGIAKVVIANIDNNPKVNHSGINRLRANGLTVVTGVLEREALRLNSDFFFAYQHKRPFVRMKVATSLDGKIAMANGQSKWITGDLARNEVQLLRAQTSAIITGSNTVIIDNANLNIRDNIPLDGILKELALKYQPLKVLIDSKLQVPTNLNFFDSGKIVVANTVAGSPDFINSGDKVDLKLLLSYLFEQYQITSVLIEAGSALNSLFLGQNLVDEVHWFTAPKVLGASAKQVFNFELEHLNQAVNLQPIASKMLDNDLYQVFKV